MSNWIETLGVLLAGAGLFIFGWMLLGRLLTPVGGAAPVLAVLPAAGDGETLEHNVKGLLWLRGGDLARFTVVIADCGLTEQGRAAARLLARREPEVVLCDAEELVNLVHNMAAL